MFTFDERWHFLNTSGFASVRRQSSELLDSALAHLEDAGITVVKIDAATGDDQYDALLQLRLADREHLYAVELKRRISPSSAVVKRLSPDHRTLLVAPHISDRVGEALRNQDVHYVDSVGNMYLRWDGLLLDVRGRRSPMTAPSGLPVQPLRTFNASGLKVVFALLTDTALITGSYRAIAQTSGVSLGTVHAVLTELEAAGYTTTVPRRLYRTRSLLDRWVEAYALNLWPRLTLARFDVTDPGWWTSADDALRAAGAQWGGETAAHRLNPRLRPQRAVIYAEEVPKKLAARYRFRKSDGEGMVEIRQRFWHFPTDTSATVPTPLIYADLAASGDPRLAEAAIDLRDRDALLQRLDRG